MDLKVVLIGLVVKQKIIDSNTLARLVLKLINFYLTI